MSISDILITFGLFVLFVLLTPGILVTLPKTKKASKYTVALVHGVIFAVVMHLIYMYVLPNLPKLEGFRKGNTTLTWEQRQAEQEKQRIALEKEEVERALPPVPQLTALPQYHISHLLLILKKILYYIKPLEQNDKQRTDISNKIIAIIKSIWDDYAFMQNRNPMDQEIKLESIKSNTNKKGLPDLLDNSLLTELDQLHQLGNPNTTLNLGSLVTEMKNQITLINNIPDPTKPPAIPKQIVVPLSKKK